MARTYFQLGPIWVGDFSWGHLGPVAKAMGLPGLPCPLQSPWTEQWVRVVRAGVRGCSMSVCLWHRKLQCSTILTGGHSHCALAQPNQRCDSGCPPHSVVSAPPMKWDPAVPLLCPRAKSSSFSWKCIASLCDKLELITSLQGRICFNLGSVCALLCYLLAPKELLLSLRWFINVK